MLAQFAAASPVPANPSSCVLPVTVPLLCRDLAQSSIEYSTAFGEHGAIEPLVGLLDDPSKPTTLLAAQALACMVACEPCSSQIR